MRLADRASRLYAPVVHAAALLTMVGWILLGATWLDAIVTAIAGRIITCPCALGLAIPTVQTVASGVTQLGWRSELSDLFVGVAIIIAVGADLLRERARRKR